MDLHDYETLIADALRRGETIVFGCRCRIRYSGRAESELLEGDRIFLIKNDKSVLIHQPHGSTPINYMKSGASVSVKIDAGTLQLHATNLAPKENIDASITRIHFYNSALLQDGEVIRVAGTEADMSNMLYDKPELLEEGFRPASREEQTKYGFIDVMGTDKQGRLTVVECKRYCADLAAVTQLRRYVEKLMVSKGISQVRGILAAPKITENAKKMLEDWGYEFKVVTPPKYLEEQSKMQAKLDVF